MMSLVVVIGLVAACTASPSLYFSGPQYYSGYYPAAVVSPIKSQYHAQNEQGQYAYGYNDGYSSKSETKHANGLTEGAYSYVDPNGVLQQYKYVSDENGYRVSGTNLPVAPAVPAVQAYAAQAYVAAPAAVPAVQTYAAQAYAYNTAEAPQPVQDTPEVAAAKVAHQVAYDQAKKAADESPAEEAPVDYNTPVQDTPEVAAAKVAHQEAHEQAKQAVGYQSYAVSAPAPVASYAYAAAPAPAYSYVANGELPQPVQDTPEVAAAKAAHQVAFDQAKKAAEEAPSDEPSAAAVVEAVEVPAAVVKSAPAPAPAPAVAYGYQTAYPSYAVAAPAPVPVAASYAYAAPAYKYAAVAPAPVAASYGYAAAPAYAYAPFASGSYSPVHSQYHSQDEFGQYSYGYNSGSSSKAEVKTLDGVTRGGYSYVDSNGVLQHYNYVSDAVNGFRVAGTNLPSNTL